MNVVEKAAKTVEDAISEALVALTLSREEVDITILDEGAKGAIFGIGSRPARVRVEKKKDVEDIVKDFLRDTIVAMGMTVRIETNRKGRFLYADLFGDNMGILIGKHGATLDSLQYIANLVIGRLGHKDVSVIVDTESYRKRRRDTLEGLARSLSRKVRDTKQSVKLEPMSRFERHVIHTALQNDKFVSTQSEGNEPYRHVILSYKK